MVSIGAIVFFLEALRGSAALLDFFVSMLVLMSMLRPPFDIILCLSSRDFLAGVSLQLTVFRDTFLFTPRNPKSIQKIIKYLKYPK